MNKRIFLNEKILHNDDNTIWVSMSEDVESLNCIMKGNFDEYEFKRSIDLFEIIDSEPGYHLEILIEIMDEAVSRGKVKNETRLQIIKLKLRLMRTLKELRKAHNYEIDYLHA